MKKPTVYPFVEQIINPLISANDKCLEVGCGAMQYRHLLNCDYYGLDLPDSPYLDEKPHYTCKIEDLDAPKDTFGMIFSVGVLCCISDIDTALRKMYHVLEPGGFLIVFDYQKHVAKRLMKKDANHFQAFDYNELSTLLIDTGFDQNSIVDKSHMIVATQKSFKENIKSILGVPSQWENWLAVQARKIS